MCWPLWDWRQWTRVDRSASNQSECSSMCHIPTWFSQLPRLVEEATSGLTVTTRAAISGAAPREVEQEPPEGLLSRLAALVGSRRTRSAAGAGPSRCGGRRAGAGRRPRRPSPPGCRARSGAHGAAGSAPRSRPSWSPLLVGQQRRVVTGVALRGQAPGFDRVGQDHRRPVGDLVGGGEGFQQVTEVVTTEVAQAGGDGGVVERRRATG